MKVQNGFKKAAKQRASGVIGVNGINDCGEGAGSPDFVLILALVPETPVII